MNKDRGIRLASIRKNFGTRPVLNNVSLAVNDGEIVSVLGASGSGKSTLLRCMNLLEIPDSGSISIAGETLSFMPGRNAIIRQQLDRIRSRTGMVFQGFNLWPHLTVLENITEAPIHVHGKSRAEARDTALDLLEKVGLADRSNAWPGTLSGGQQQRVAIARALAVQPQLLLFDEPTSALDPESVRGILDLIGSLAGQGCTMVIVTHELGFARRISDRILFLEDGRIKADAPPEAMFSGAISENFNRFTARHP